jgi:hypothetical protein
LPSIHPVVSHQIVAEVAAVAAPRRRTAGLVEKKCDQPQPPNVTEAIADRERDR